MKLLLRRFDKTVQRGVNRHLIRFICSVFSCFSQSFSKKLILNDHCNSVGIRENRFDMALK